jgi:hypothetical protein
MPDQSRFLGLEGEITNGCYRRDCFAWVHVNVEALNIVVVCGVALAASLLLFIWSAHLGPAPTIELRVMNWI